MCLRERERETKIIGVCACVCVGGNVGVRYVPSVRSQSEISLAANNSKTRK